MHKAAPELYAIDLDQTVYRTDLAFDKMVRIAVTHGLAAADAIATARAEVERSRGSFDLIGYLAVQGVSATELTDLQRTFGKNEEGDDLLYPDAHGLFTALQQTDTPFFIHTKGGSRTQLSKLESCGLIDWPYRITDSTHKGREISDMRLPDGGYGAHAAQGYEGRDVLLHADSVYLLEDKAEGFDGLPLDCNGALLHRSESRRVFRQGDVPPRIALLKDLATVTERVYRTATEAA